MKRVLLLALLVLALPATAQPTEFGFEEDYLARVAQGDISITAVAEPAGWNVAEYLRFDHDGNQTSLPLGGVEATIVDASCECGNVTVDGARLLIGNDVAAGQYVVRLVRNLGETRSLDASFALYGGQTGRLVAYIPTGFDAATDATLLTTGLPCTTGGCDIEEYSMAGAVSFLIVPEGVINQGPADDDDGVMAEYGLALVALLLGAAVWAALVQKGFVQKRRAQEVKVAAHVEAAQAESADTLTTRKRVLMAGMKELEKARMQKEVETDVYDALKAELKKETLTVMRALETQE